eukprot:2960566-Heterocapsa_arctica.AAC.1
MEAGRSWRDRPLGQQNCAVTAGRVASLRHPEPWQGTQGQLRRAFPEKQQTHRGLASFTRNDRNCDWRKTNVNDDRSGQYIAEYSKQKGDSQRQGAMQGAATKKDA